LSRNERRPPRLRPDAGVAAVHGLALALLVLVCIAALMPLAPAMGRQFACQLREALRALGDERPACARPAPRAARRARARRKRPAVRRAAPDPRADLIHRLRQHERHLNRFWQEVHGSAHRSPRVRMVPWLDPSYPLTTGSYEGRYPRDRRRPVIRLFAGVTGDPERDFAAALWVLAHEFGHNGQADHPPTGYLEDHESELQADCLAGAYIRWARDQSPPLVSDATVRLIEAEIASRPLEPGMYPGGPRRLVAFRWGFRAGGQGPAPDPLTRC
jgi:hypothetical protein